MMNGSEGVVSGDDQSARVAAELHQEMAEVKHRSDARLEGIEQLLEILASSMKNEDLERQIQWCGHEMNRLLSLLEVKGKEYRRWYNMCPYFPETIDLKAELGRLWRLVDAWRVREYDLQQELEVEKQIHTKLVAEHQAAIGKRAEMEDAKKVQEQKELEAKMQQALIEAEKLKQAELQQKELCWRDHIVLDIRGEENEEAEETRSESNSRPVYSEAFPDVLIMNGGMDNKLAGMIDPYGVLSVAKVELVLLEFFSTVSMNRMCTEMCLNDYALSSYFEIVGFRLPPDKVSIRCLIELSGEALSIVLELQSDDSVKMEWVPIILNDEKREYASNVFAEMSLLTGLCSYRLAEQINGWAEWPTGIGNFLGLHEMYRKGNSTSNIELISTYASSEVDYHLCLSRVDDKWVASILVDYATGVAESGSKWMHHSTMDFKVVNWVLENGVLARENKGGVISCKMIRRVATGWGIVKACVQQEKWEVYVIDNNGMLKLSAVIVDLKVSELVQNREEDLYSCFNDTKMRWYQARKRIGVKPVRQLSSNLKILIQKGVMYLKIIRGMNSEALIMSYKAVMGIVAELHKLEHIESILVMVQLKSLKWLAHHWIRMVGIAIDIYNTIVAEYLPKLLTSLNLPKEQTRFLKMMNVQHPTLYDNKLGTGVFFTRLITLNRLLTQLMWDSPNWDQFQRNEESVMGVICQWKWILYDAFDLWVIVVSSKKSISILATLILSIELGDACVFNGGKGVRISGITQISMHMNDGGVVTAQETLNVPGKVHEDKVTKQIYIQKWKIQISSKIQTVKFSFDIEEFKKAVQVEKEYQVLEGQGNFRNEISLLMVVVTLGNKVQLKAFTLISLLVVINHLEIHKMDLIVKVPGHSLKFFMHLKMELWHDLILVIKKYESDIYCDEFWSTVARCAISSVAGISYYSTQYSASDWDDVVAWKEDQILQSSMVEDKNPVELRFKESMGKRFYGIISNKGDVRFFQNAFCLANCCIPDRRKQEKNLIILVWGSSRSIMWDNIGAELRAILSHPSVKHDQLDAIGVAVGWNGRTKLKKMCGVMSKVWPGLDKVLITVKKIGKSFYYEFFVILNFEKELEGTKFRDQVQQLSLRTSLFYGGWFVMIQTYLTKWLEEGNSSDVVLEAEVSANGVVGISWVNYVSNSYWLLLAYVADVDWLDWSCYGVVASSHSKANGPKLPLVRECSSSSCSLVVPVHSASGAKPSTRGRAIEGP